MQVNTTKSKINRVYFNNDIRSWIITTMFLLLFYLKSSFNFGHYGFYLLFWNFHVFFFISYVSLLRLSIFYSFISSMFLIVCWSMFITTSLKSLSDNPNILVLALVDLSFKLRSSWFLVWVVFESWIVRMLCLKSLDLI